MADLIGTLLGWSLAGAAALRPVVEDAGQLDSRRGPGGRETGEAGTRPPAALRIPRDRLPAGEHWSRVEAMVRQYCAAAERAGEAQSAVRAEVEQAEQALERLLGELAQAAGSSGSEHRAGAPPALAALSAPG